MGIVAWAASDPLPGVPVRRLAEPTPGDRGEGAIHFFVLPSRLLRINYVQVEPPRFSRHHEIYRWSAAYIFPSLGE